MELAKLCCLDSSQGKVNPESGDDVSFWLKRI